MSVGPFTRAAVNVLAGWMGWPTPTPPKQRNATRAAYRKTARKRAPDKDAPAADEACESRERAA